MENDRGTLNLYTFQYVVDAQITLYIFIYTKLEIGQLPKRKRGAEKYDALIRAYLNIVLNNSTDREIARLRPARTR